MELTVHPQSLAAALTGEEKTYLVKQKPTLQTSGCKIETMRFLWKAAFFSSFLSPFVAVIQKPTCYVQMSNWFYLSETKCYENGSPEQEWFGFIEIEHVVRVIWIYTLIAFCYISFEEYTRDTYRIQDTHWRGGWRAHTHTHTPSSTDMHVATSLLLA